MSNGYKYAVMGVIYAFKFSADLDQKCALTVYYKFFSFIGAVLV
jgi:hypothetical protein